jgi:polyisoprenoid-binding protein YceI
MEKKWHIDPAHSSVLFTAQYMDFSKISGQFREFEGTLTQTQEDFDNSTVQFSAKVSSIDTNQQQRDGHLQSAEFFDAESYPELQFSGKLRKEDIGEFTHILEGQFKSKGQQIDCVLHVSKLGEGIDMLNNKKAGFLLKGVVNRMEMGLKWDEKSQQGKRVLEDKVEITVQVQLKPE